MAENSSDLRPATPRRSMGRWWLLLLAAPYAALCFPSIYTRPTPVLWGVPFFYWYQFAWVLLTSALLGVVYRAIRHTDVS